MTRTVDLPLANYPNGSRSTSFRSIPDNATRISVEVARCTTADPTIWPNASTMLDLSIDLSTDGGNTFLRATSGQIAGGIQPGLHGQEATVTRISMVDIPPGTGRSVRLSAVISGGPLRTFGTIEIT
jgi:hypothetical protein